MEKRKIEKNYILLGLTALLFLLLYSYSTSPLYPYAYGWDSDFFRLVGEGMTKGYLPYRDFFDMKGPWLFFLEALGQLIWKGKTGAFILQFVHLFLVFVICYKINSRYWKQKSSGRNLLTLLPMLVIYGAAMEGGNLTEDISLLYLMIPLYFSLDYIQNEKEEHPPLYALIYGCCFGILALIRITNTVLICAIVLTVLVELIRTKKWKNLGCNMLFFVAGVFLAFLPALVYYGVQGELANMLYCTFVFGFIYGTDGFAFGAGKLYLVTLCFTPLVLGRTKEKNKKLWLLVLSNLVGMLIVLSMGNSSMHDYLLILPGVMIGVWQLAALRERICVPKLLILGITVICFLYPAYKLLGTTKSLVTDKNDPSCWENVQETAAEIPEESRDSVWGYGIPIRWYTMAQIMPCNRYLAWQDNYIRLSPKVKEEIYEMLETAPPGYIVTMTQNNIQDAYVLETLQENYETVVQNEDFTLYERKGK